MSIKFEKKTFVKWLETAQMTDVTYHRSRQVLWSGLQKCAKEKGGEYLKIDRHIFNSLKGILTSRSEGIDDTKRLAFDTALEEIAGAVADVEVADDDDVPPSLVVQSEEKEEKEAPKAAS